MTNDRHFDMINSLTFCVRRKDNSRLVYKTCQINKMHKRNVEFQAEYANSFLSYGPPKLV